MIREEKGLRVAPNPETLCRMLDPWDPTKLPFRDVLVSAEVGWKLATKGGDGSFFETLAVAIGTSMTTARRWHAGTAMPHPLVQPGVVARILQMMRGLKVDFDAPLEENGEEDLTPPASTLHPK